MQSFISRAAARHFRSWGHGAGMVGDVFSYPPGNPDQCAIRISIAAIDNAVSTFSYFPGRTRLHVLIAGETELSVQDTVHPLTGRFPQLSFPGDVPTVCRLRGGPARAFNIVQDATVNSSWVRPVEVASMERIKLQSDASPSGAGYVLDLFFVARGSLCCAGDVEDVELGHEDALVLVRDGAAEAAITLVGQATLLHACVIARK